MSHSHFFPQPEPLQDRYFEIQREYVDRNPTGFGYLRGSKPPVLTTYQDILKEYRRKMPNVTEDTVRKEARLIYEKMLEDKEEFNLLNE